MKITAQSVSFLFSSFPGHDGEKHNLTARCRPLRTEMLLSAVTVCVLKTTAIVTSLGLRGD